MSLENVTFAVLFIASITLFTTKVRQIRKNILIGQPADRSDNKPERWRTMLKVAIGQSKMVVRPVAGILHIIVYVGFVIINIEVLEIVIDGIAGTHRILSFMGGFYDALIASFEILALGVFIACAIFLIRRNILHIRRFHYREMTAWPKSDANIILIMECLLMGAFLLMNAADYTLQQRGIYHEAGAFPVSSVLSSALGNMNTGGLIITERVCWWFHIVGIFAFLNYIPFSKHFHIVLAFPNVFYSNLCPKGQFTNLESVTNEVKLMMDPSADPYAVPAEGAAPQRFGAKDVQDLSWKQLLDAYSCTECGRCSANCPATQTGKLLSPRKIMMDTRDRLEIVGENIRKNGKEFSDGQSLLYDHILPEEVWACTTCNACTESCPVNIDPLSIIIDLRRYLVMEESKAPSELAMMNTNIENNGAPWQFSPADRLKWASEP